MNLEKNEGEDFILRFDFKFRRRFRSLELGDAVGEVDALRAVDPAKSEFELKFEFAFRRVIFDFDLGGSISIQLPPLLISPSSNRLEVFS